MLRALSHEGRLMTLCYLVEGERSVGALEAALDAPQPYVSQVLARLRADGLVSTRRDGRVIYYRLADSRVRPVLESLHGVFCEPKD